MASGILAINNHRMRLLGPEVSQSQKLIIPERVANLPTEAEWEYVARGGDGRENPWGDEPYDPENPQVTFNKQQTESVYAHDDIEHPFGIKNLAGNVWKWLMDWYGEYDPNELVNPKGLASGTTRVLRGGSWNNNIGFRLLEYLRMPESVFLRKYGACEIKSRIYSLLK